MYFIMSCGLFMKTHIQDHKNSSFTHKVLSKGESVQVKQETQAEAERLQARGAEAGRFKNCTSSSPHTIDFKFWSISLSSSSSSLTRLKQLVQDDGGGGGGVRGGGERGVNWPKWVKWWCTHALMMHFRNPHSKTQSSLVHQLCVTHRTAHVYMRLKGVVQPFLNGFLCKS